MSKRGFQLSAIGFQLKAASRRNLAMSKRGFQLSAISFQLKAGGQMKFEMGSIRLEHEEAEG
jgi:hypothetical protein